MAGKTVRRFLDGLGYAVHTPASVFGRARLEQHVYDEEWLPIVGSNGWAVFCRDQHILDRELELKAYLDARVHMFVLPGNATRLQIMDLLGSNLGEICTLAVARRPNVYWLKPGAVISYERRRAETIRRRVRGGR
jgi:hypothetical protein